MIMKKMMHNWQWKLLSLVISVVFWAMIVNYDDPLVTVSFTGIPVSIENEDAITSQNMAVEYLDGETISVTLRGKRTIIDKMTSSDVKAYADLSRVSITNAVDITIDAGEQVDVIRKTPNEMLIATEEIKSILKSVQVRYDGTLAEDYIKLTATVTPNQIEVTGPESKLGLVSSVVVPIDVEGASEDISVFVAPKLLDSSGDVVRDLEISNNQIQVKVPVQKTKSIPVTIQRVGTLSDEYRLISMAVETSRVTIRGEAEAVDAISRIVIDDISLDGMTDLTTPVDVNLTDYLPEDIAVYEPGAATSVTVIIEPIVESSYVINQEDITVSQIPESLQFHFVDEIPYEITVKGIESELATLTVEDLSPSINLKDLDAGVHRVEMSLTIPSGFELSTEVPLVRVELLEGDAAGEELNVSEEE